MTSEQNRRFESPFDYPVIKVRGFKWPRRPTSVANAYLLGTDTFGHWLGVTKGSSWTAADGSRRGVFDQSFVKLGPNNTFWTVCFHPRDPVVDVDIVLPVRWYDNTLEVDLELDILRYVDGRVLIRDQDVFDHLREAWTMPTNIVTMAQATCEHVRFLVEQTTEPFGAIGLGWLSAFLASVATIQE
jgi:hypothetical protein